MSELDEAWARALADAQLRARAAGRRDIADYLALRASNDLLRQTGIEWLMTTATILAGQANRSGASIQIAQQDEHRFEVGNSTMVGKLLNLSFGLRVLSIEAGWPRAPSDGFIRGGGLARGHLKHVGAKSANEELLLMRSQKGGPQWMVIGKSGSTGELLEAGIQHHIDKLLSDDYR